MKNRALLTIMIGLLLLPVPRAAAETLRDYSLLPPFVSAGVSPLVMLVLGRDHKLYYEAYNDLSDLDADGVIDVGYKPAIEYYGYFDSYKQYVYNSAQNRFDPVALTADKKVTAAGRWSGDFLNYLTMSRMDVMRKVLYGGYRATDSTSETVLQRVYIPQDAHSWGKEYESIARDGYDIREYTPLDLPGAGTRHLFASTTLSENGVPLLRVLPDNPGRIWEWVAKERPVADSSMEIAAGGGAGHPGNHSEYDDLVMTYGTVSKQLGSGSVSRIDGSGNPFTSQQDNFLTLFDGELVIKKQGSYDFAVDGNDAVEVIIDGQVVAGWYGGHGSCGCTTHDGSIDLDGGVHTIEFRHEEGGGGDSYRLHWNGPDSGGSWRTVPAIGSAPNDFGLKNLTRTVYDLTPTPSTITDYQARVKVCDPAMPEPNCKSYPGGTSKPVGLLQRHGESGSMFFGLLTGSYTKNTSGGVLRKNIGSITDEIDGSTGQFKTTVNGIIQTINKLRTDGFTYSNFSYNENCGWVTTREINAGECRMWGNPVGEMMYESLRYFAGKASPTGAFTYDGTSTHDDNQLGLAKPGWQDPYARFPSCSKPFMLVLSDINPSFDSDQLPGSEFQSFSGDLPGLVAGSLADLISLEEGIGGDYYIGQVGNTYDDGAPTAKAVTTLGNIRGLAPEEPTKQGSYYSASVAYYGRTTDLNAVPGDQKVITYSVALASPLPRIEIPVAGQTITLVPFAKSVGGASINPARGQFQPTNTIVDVFMEELTPTSGKFRINFEDVEQGADHDMDAIVVYEYQLNADNTVTISLDSTYAAGGIIQHMGYVISGTTADGTYLEVRDRDTSASSDPDYYLDTPPGDLPGGSWNDGQPLPLQTSRTFTPGTNTAASLLKNPLWYAAKWGGFDDMNGDSLPDQQREWNSDQDPQGDPDTYFYVTNPLKLEEQLNKSFAEILRRSSSGTAASVVSSSRSGEGAVYQSIFYPEYSDQHGNIVNWIGDTRALFIDKHGNLREDSNRNARLDLANDLIVEFSADLVRKYADADADGEKDDPVNPTASGSVRDVPINYLWSAADWLNSLSESEAVSQRSSYLSSNKNRHILTFVDGNLNMVPDAGELVPFVETQASILPFIHGLPPFDVTAVPAYLNGITIPSTDFRNFLTIQRKRVINYIRGQEQGIYVNTSPSYVIPAFRNRRIDFNGQGEKTWRLGDIVHSSPTLLGPPQEDYDLLYSDGSYSAFYSKYKNRRNVVYLGGNDGMLHAFNGGFFDKTQNKFWKSFDATSTSPFSDGSGPDLGAELWAYVPFNLLPHLYWLTDAGYNANDHVAYVDLKPRIFDAKIFPADAEHPNGWGTILVCGMRFGGGAITPDTNGDNSKTGESQMSSAFIVMDVTNPEGPPKLLGELSFPGMGFTTVYPTMIPMRDRGDLLVPPTTPSNEWYLVLGSGPHASGGAIGRALSDGTSNQGARLFLVDMKKLATDKQLYTLDSSGVSRSGAHAFANLDANSFVSDPVTIDYDFDYKADAVYFGTVSGNFSAGWGGKLRRIVIDNDNNTSSWDGDSTLIDLGLVHDGQPIVAAPSVALSEGKDRWVYFGTGRFFNRQDISNASTGNDPQSYYGIKEPYTVLPAGKDFTWGTVSASDLLNVTGVEVYDGGFTLLDPSGNVTQSTFDELVQLMDKPSNDVAYQAGWYRNLGLRERNLGQAALIGDILTYTAYTPSADICEIEGNSMLYGLYYKTGTAYKKSVVGLGTKTVGEDTDGDGTVDTQKKIILTGVDPPGLVTTPNLHMGSNVLMQTSTGAIEKIEQVNPGQLRSGSASWKEE